MAQNGISTVSEARQRLARVEATRKRQRMQAAEVRGQLVRSGTAAVVAIASGYYFGGDQTRQFLDSEQELPTAPILSAGLAIAAVMTNGDTSTALEGAALGLGIPWLAQWGRDRGAAAAVAP